MINLMEREFVDKKKWATREDMMDMVIISESTPGGVAINSATFVGYKMGGVLAAVVATLGIVLPSFILVAAVYFAMGAVLDNIWVAAALKGIRICVVVLIFNAVMSLFGLMERNAYGFVVLIASFVVATFTNFSVIYLILIGGVLGVLYTRLIKKDAKLPVSRIRRELLNEEEAGPGFDGQNQENVSAEKRELSSGTEGARDFGYDKEEPADGDSGAEDGK